MMPFSCAADLSIEGAAFERLRCDVLQCRWDGATRGICTLPILYCILKVLEQPHHLIMKPQVFPKPSSLVLWGYSQGLDGHEASDRAVSPERSSQSGKFPTSPLTPDRAKNVGVEIVQGRQRVREFCSNYIEDTIRPLQVHVFQISCENILELASFRSMTYSLPTNFPTPSVRVFE